jgi:hypothetical protein
MTLFIGAKQLDIELMRQACVYLLLHWGILLEIGDGYARVDRRVKGADLLEIFRRESGCRIVSLTESLMAEAISLYRQLSDKNWELTDCVSFFDYATGGRVRRADRRCSFQTGWLPRFAAGVMLHEDAFHRMS